MPVLPLVVRRSLPLAVASLLLGLLLSLRLAAPPVLAEPPDQESAPSPVIVSEPEVGEAVAPFSFDGDLRALPRTLYQGDPLLAPELVLPDPDRKNEESGDAGPTQPYTSPANIQREQGPTAMPAPQVVFNGLDNFDNVTALGTSVNPPDTVGDVGPNHYIQMVNLVFSIYNKTGTPLIPPTPLSAIFAASPTGTPCDTTNSGDPIVVYDPMADRWVLSQFAVPGPDYYECIAVSKTPDPISGGWWLYVIRAPFRIFNDFPKLSVWPDGYYMTAPMFPNSGGAIYGGIWALERSQMLAGRPARSLYYTVSTSFPRLLPSNLRGDAPPPNSPNYLLSFQVPDKLALWELDVDWDDPTLSSLTGPTYLPVAPFLEACPGTRDCVPFLGSIPATQLDDLSPRLMMQLQYRRVGNTESLWVTQTVDEPGRTVPRWYEIRDPGGSPTVYQQGTYAPADGVWRWMGSMAADRMGNAALGYSASSPLIEPGIRYVGRLVSDPINTLPQAEAIMTVGTGHPTHDNSRWGDYSAMTVDPVDDCTFWYTTEYYTATIGTAPTTAGNKWATQIGSFAFPSCVPLAAPGSITGQVLDAVTSAPLANVPLIATNQPLTRTYAGATDASGTFTLTVQPGTYTLTAGPITGYTAATSAPVTVASNGNAPVTILLGPLPHLIGSTTAVSDPAPGGNANGAPEPGESNVQILKTIENDGATTASNVSGQLIALTPGVTVVTANAAYPNLEPGMSAANTTPFVISVGTLACGTRLDFEEIVTSDQGTYTIPFSIYTGLPGTPVTFNATGLPQPIPNNERAVGVSASLNLPDTFAVADANVSVDITHINDADVEIHLTSPAGVEVDLSADNGGTGDNYTGTTFDDEAATPITAGTAPFTGSFRPEAPLTMVDGERATGTWTLHVYDDALANTGGTLNAFGLTLQPYACTFLIPNLSVANTAYAENGGNTNGNGYIDPGEDSIDLRVALQNAGIPNLTAATALNATVSPLTPNVTMNVATSPYPDIAPNATQTDTVAYNFALSSSAVCGMPLPFQIVATAAQGTFTDTFAIPTGAAPVPATLLVETVESGTNGWTTTTTNPAFPWAITTEQSNSPTHSWTDSPGTNYPNNLQSWLQSPPLDLSAYETVDVTFAHSYTLESGFDFGYVEVSRDGGASWEAAPLASYTGAAAWTQVTLSAPALAHQPNARVRFRLFSDAGVNEAGWHIDDITISGGRRDCAPPTSITLDKLSVQDGRAIGLLPLSLLFALGLLLTVAARQHLRRA